MTKLAIIYSMNNTALSPIVINAAAFEALCSDGEIFTTHASHGPKALVKDDQVIKVFYRKKGFTSQHFFPPYKRFINSAVKLQNHGIHAPHIKACYVCPEKKCYVLCYEKIPGTDLRALLQTSPPALLEAFIVFLAQLHAKGIFFRALHLANVVKNEQGFALIDMSDCYFFSSPLKPWVRARNIRRLIDKPVDREIFTAFGIDKFIEKYVHAAELSVWQRKLFWFWMR